MTLSIGTTTTSVILDDFKARKSGAPSAATAGSAVRGGY